LISAKLPTNKFSLDTLWLVFSQGILYGSGLLINLFIGYKYGAAILGEFNQILGFYLILTTLISLGINNAIIQKISTQEPENHQKIFSAGLFSTVTSGIFFTALVLLLTGSHPNLLSSENIAKGLFATALSFPFFNVNKNFMAYCTGIRNQKLFANSRAFRWMVILLFILIVGFGSLQVSWLYFSFLAAELALSTFFFFRFRFLLTLNFEIHQIYQNLSFGIKSFVAEIFSIMNDKFDVVLLGYFLGSAEVGIYSFVTFFAKSLYIFPGILQQNINPIIGKHWSGGKMDELQEQLRKLRRTNLAVVSLQMFSIAAFYFVLTEYFQPEFKGTSPYLWLALLGAFVFATICWGGSVLVMVGKLRANIARTLLILVFSIASIVVLSHIFGLWGGVWAMVLNAIFSFWMLFGFVRRETGIRLV
jgi:O-antigen/teichoic acid export membrane protein